MKKMYEAPEVYKIEFDVEDVLAASGTDILVDKSQSDGTAIGNNAVDLW